MQEQLTVAVSRGHGNEVLEQRSCSILIAMYEMHGQLIIISVTTLPSLSAIAESDGGVEFKVFLFNHRNRDRTIIKNFGMSLAVFIKCENGRKNNYGLCN